MSANGYHVSKNRLSGSLADTSLHKLLKSCAEHLITGTITIDAPLAKGDILLRAGCVFEASYMGLEGEAAVDQMKQLIDGSYELAQRIPNLDGDMGSAAECRGDIAHAPIIEIMQHCEEHALSCTITVIRDFDRAEIVYKAGDIKGVLFNGRPNEDKLVDVVKWTEGKYRIKVPPLAMDIDGWPTTGRDPTAPFNIADIAKYAPPPKRKRAPSVTASSAIVTPAPVMPPPIPQSALRMPSAPLLFAETHRAITVTPVPEPIIRTRTGPSVPVLPVVEMRADSSGQLSLRTPTIPDNTSRATPALGVLMMLMFAGLFGVWVVIAMLIGAI